ncbi:MAG: c-type cytochrome domain-containing protein [Opitutia bacterium]
MRNLALLTLVSATSTFAASDADREKAFKADIAPILEKSCIGCHGKDKTKKPKGGFDATSLASVVKGGKESGAGITWGDASKSSLFKTSELGISSPDDDLAMPPKKAKERHPLTKEQLEKVKAFIESNK